MNQKELIFIHYLSCFLNSRQPNLVPDEWKTIFNLAEINSVTGIVAHEIRQLPREQQPTGKARAYFVQTLGATICRYDEKQLAQQRLEAFLEKSNIDYAYVKGGVIRDYYPAPELRTSGDVDVVVRPSKYNDVIKAFRESGFDLEDVNAGVIVAKIDDLIVEVHNGADVLGDYFSNSFFDRCTNDGNRYSLDQYDQLLYVILHLARHLKDRGAGVRMLMDIDVCIRAIDDFDNNKLLKMCADAGIEKCAKTLFSLANYWFDTPVEAEIDFENEAELLEMLANSFLHGGVFGEHNNNLGSHYVAQATDGQSLGFVSKIKSLFVFFFPSANTIKHSYLYAYNHPILIPLGYVNRFFDGVFKRGAHSLKTAKQIFSVDNSVLIEKQIQNELEIF